MTSLVWLDHEAGAIKQPSRSAVAAAAKLGEVHVLVAGAGLAEVTAAAAKLPGVAKVKDQLDASGLDDKLLSRQEAIILSMTRQERAKPDVINGSRRKRIAAGSGVDVSDVNKLLKMHRQMSDVMKKMGKGGRAMQGLSALFGGGGMPPGMPPRR